jgi:P pilus assembly chaperone PapD
MNTASTPRSTSLACLTAFALAAATAHAQAPGDLLVAPTRVVFEGRERSAAITLVNTGDATATYRISFVNLRMNDEGGTAEVETSGATAGELFAAELVRYSPRQVTLAPKVAQTVRIQLRLPAGLAPGEYRSHLLFRAVPSPATPSATAERATELSIQLTAILGISIPVIVRHGTTRAAASLSDLDIVPATALGGPQSLGFRIHRTGNQSIYGDFTATFVPARGTPTVVAIANGVAVYTPNLGRTAALTLRPPPGVVLADGRLHLAYTMQGKGNETIAEADLLVP